MKLTDYSPNKNNFYYSTTPIMHRSQTDFDKVTKMFEVMICSKDVKERFVSGESIQHDYMRVPYPELLKIKSYAKPVSSDDLSKMIQKILKHNSMAESKKIDYKALFDPILERYGDLK